MCEDDVREEGVSQTNPHDAFQGFVYLFSLVHMHARVCVCVFMCTVCVQVPEEARRG